MGALLCSYFSSLFFSFAGQLNAVLSEFGSQYHRALGVVPVASQQQQQQDVHTTQLAAPRCKHGPAKISSVRKPGRTKDRLFYSCAAPQKSRCDFFEWVSDNVALASPRSAPKGIEAVLHCKGMGLYTQCDIFCSSR
jgi:hypothetical protein